MNYPADTAASRQASRLLALLGEQGQVGEGDHPALAWRRAGLMAITGRAEGPGLVCPAMLASAADGALLALRALAPDPHALPANGAALLGERAQLMGLQRRGRVSANGSCRLIDTSDGCIALNLAREDDWELMPILVGADTTAGWPDVESGTARLAVAEVMERGIELGLPIAHAGPWQDAPAFAHESATSPSDKRDKRAPLVLDFSALWAGPLAASLLGMLGAHVVKVESATRPDGARRGHAGFYDLLNAGKSSVAIDFADSRQLARLRRLIDRADIIIEGSRPRALRRLGIDREVFVGRGGIWLSITAHPDPNRVGFGDDAAMAAGIAAVMAQGWGEALFAGDAIADPLTGLYAAVAAWAIWRRGEAGLVRLSLAGTVAHAIGLGIADPGELRAWQALAEADKTPLYPLRTARAPGRAPGADNSLLDEMPIGRHTD